MRKEAKENLFLLKRLKKCELTMKSNLKQREKKPKIIKLNLVMSAHFFDCLCQQGLSLEIIKKVDKAYTLWLNELLKKK